MSEDGGPQHRPQESESSILGSLPRSRPQRSSPRRTSAQAKAAKQPAKPARPKRTAKPTSKKASAARAAPPRRREPPAPRQGYESQEEPRLGATVHPPSGVELVESIATIFAELASAGVKAGGRVLKDALSPIRRP